MILLDDEDKWMLDKHNWCLSGSGYAQARVKGEIVYLHHLILYTKKGLVIDHINHNKLDNRRSNLRYATRSQNEMNKQIQKNNTSGFRGVSWAANVGKWRSCITLQGKFISLGYYSSKKEASDNYQIVAKKLFGEYYS